MDPEIIKLLHDTPGIIRIRGSVVREGIELLDWTKLLTLTLSNTVREKQWVRVCRGLYKGDIGFVIEANSWGVEVLLIPRLNASTTDAEDLALRLKRKRSKIIPQPALFEEIVLKSIYDIEPRKRAEDYFTCQGHNFEHGLLRKAYDFHSIKADVLTIPSYNFHLFQFCDHPAVSESSFPRPQEWIFEEGERVSIRSSGRKGVVAAIANDYLEVDLGEENGSFPYSWDDVWKTVQVGDFITVTSGRLRGALGFVDGVTGEEVNFIERQAAEIGDVVHHDHITMLQVRSLPSYDFLN